LRTPVAFLIFNRPDKTARVFAEIARARPPKLLVVADGPRENRAGEREACLATRAIIERVDWPCEVLTNYAESNLGCKARVSSGLDWVFNQVEEAIILEDDCLPHPTFFPFCEELLERYRTDERVAMICGTSFQKNRSSNYSYYFSRHTTVWGWASWRRVWQHYDVEMKLWPELRQTSWLSDLLVNRVAVRYWRGIFDMMYEAEVERSNTWDYQLFFSWWVRYSLAVTPNVNLVSNLGFGEGATHTREALKTMAEIPVEAIELPLRHPPYIHLERKVDDHAFRHICPWIIENQNLYWRLRHRFTNLLPDSWRRSVRRLRAKRVGGAL
jgi:hypothetical protein